MLEMSTISMVLFILAIGVFIFQIFMVAGWIAVIHRGTGGSVPYWPLIIAVALTIAAILTR